LIKRIPVRVGFDGQFAFRYVPNWYQNFFTHKVQVPRRDHEINVNLGIIKVLGIPTICSVPIIIPGKDALENAKTFYIRHGVSKKATIVGLQPGSSPDQAWKRWPMEYYQELIRWCQSQGFTVLIFGSDKERKICESLRGPKGTVLAVGEHIQLVAALLKQCAVLVSHDSFLIHLACALGVPNLGLYGPTDVIWSESWGEKSFQIHIRRECRYCYSQDPENPATCDVNCMSEISPEEVIRKIKDGILVSH
jgi:ADP-heptose:LPS heptosyltransferase